MNIFALSLILLCPCIVSAQDKQGTWVQQDISIHFNDEPNFHLSHNYSVTAFICDQQGKYTPNGRFVYIRNDGEEAVFYRNSPKGLGNYTSQKSKYFITSVSNMLEYYPIQPKSFELIDLNGYENSSTRKMNMIVVIDFKLFKTKNDPGKKPGTSSTKQTGSTGPDKRVSTAPPAKKEIFFYIFLSASIPMNNKHITVISPPFYHKGMLTDDMSKYKEDFIRQIHQQLTELPEDYQQKLSANDYEKITVHYGKPYSTVLLKSEVEARDAIESFKQSIRDAVDGLPNQDLIDFIQLK